MRISVVLGETLIVGGPPCLVLIMSQSMMWFCKYAGEMNLNE